MKSDEMILESASWDREHDWLGDDEGLEDASERDRTRGGFAWGKGGNVHEEDEQNSYEWGVFTATSDSTLSADGTEVVWEHALNNAGGDITSTDAEPYSILAWIGSSSWSVLDDGPPYAENFQSVVKYVFQTGGKGVAGSQVLVEASGSASEILPESYVGVPDPQITAGAVGQLDTDGLAYTAIADGASVEVTSKTDRPLATSGPGANGDRLVHICEADTPTNKDRLTIGVGEAVDLGGMPNDTNTIWSTTAGTLSSTTGSPVTLTAPDRKATATVTVTVHGQPLQVAFGVIEPHAVNMVTNGLWHYVNRPSVGFHALCYIAPDTVNFYAVSVKEETNNAVANGVFSCINGSPHDTDPAVVPCDNIVVPGLGTPNGGDDCLSGDCGTPPSFTPGTEVFQIPQDFRVGTNAWKTFTTLTQSASLSASGVLTMSKANAAWSCNVTDPSVNYPGGE